MHVVATVAEGEDLLHRLVNGSDLGFACGAAGALLANCFPSNGAAALHDQIAAHGTALEQFNFFSI